MMMEYEQYFAMTLQQKLKKRVIGKIYVKITMNDEILVLIEREDELKFRMFISNFTRKVIDGLSTDYVARMVIKEYREFIMARMNEKYFYAS